MKKIVLALVILLSFALLFGCTEAPAQNENNENEMTENNDTTMPENNTQAEVEENNDETETQEEQVEINDEAIFQEFVDLISQLNNYKVTYDVTAEGNEFSQIQYMYDGEIRTDTTTQGVEARVFILNEGIYTCTNVGSWMCFDAPDAAEEGFDDGFEEVKANPDKFRTGITKIESQTIIGQATTCFNIVGEDFEYDYCLNSNGIPLLIEGISGGNNFKYIATDYSSSVSASDLTLPAEPGEFSFPGMQ